MEFELKPSYNRHRSRAAKARQLLAFFVGKQTYHYFPSVFWVFFMFAPHKNGKNEELNGCHLLFIKFLQIGYRAFGSAFYFYWQ